MKKDKLAQKKVAGMHLPAEEFMGYRFRPIFISSKIPTAAQIVKATKRLENKPVRPVGDSTSTKLFPVVQYIPDDYMGFAVPTSVPDDLVRDHGIFGARIAAAMMASSNETLDRLAHHEDEIVRATVARYSQTLSDETGEKLATDWSDNVRLALACNNAAPMQALLKLCGSENKFLRSRLIEVLFNREYERGWQLIISLMKHYVETEPDDMQQILQIANSFGYEYPEAYGTLIPGSQENIIALLQKRGSIPKKVINAFYELHGDTLLPTLAHRGAFKEVPSHIIEKIKNHPDAEIRAIYIQKTADSESQISEVLDNEVVAVRAAVVSKVLLEPDQINHVVTDASPDVQYALITGVNQQNLNTEHLLILMSSDEERIAKEAKMCYRRVLLNRMKVVYARPKDLRYLLQEKDNWL